MPRRLGLHLESATVSCDLSLYNTSALRRHLRDYHGRAIVTGRRGAPRRRGPAVGRREYMRQKYLERKANKAPSLPVTAARLVDEGHFIMQCHMLDEIFKHEVVSSGLLPLLQQQRSENFPHYQHMLRLVRGRVASLSRPTILQPDADEVPRVARFLKLYEMYRKSKDVQKENSPKTE
ncbi:hypothetical protein V1506DRAFT_571858 [Lipomyces tetrasporus]